MNDAVDHAPVPDRGAAAARLREALDDARIVMLTSLGEGVPSGLHSRPLTLLRVDDEGGLWFLVDAEEDWVRGLLERPGVDVSVDLHSDGLWVSVSGIAVLSDDRAAIDALWTPAAEAFWDSKDDPAIRVLRVDPSVIDIWRSASSALGRVLAIGKAILTGHTAGSDGDDDRSGESHVGEHEHLVIRPA